MHEQRWRVCIKCMSFTISGQEGGGLNLLLLERRGVRTLGTSRRSFPLRSFQAKKIHISSWPIEKSVDDVFLHVVHIVHVVRVFMEAWP